MMRDERIKNNMLIEMMNDEEHLSGGIFTKEKFYMKKYNISEKEMGLIEVMLYAIQNIDSVDDIHIDWKIK